MFGKPKSAEEIIKMIDALSDEEQDKLYAALIKLEDDEAEKPEAETAEAGETPEEPAEDPAEQTETENPAEQAEETEAPGEQTEEATEEATEEPLEAPVEAPVEESTEAPVEEAPIEDNVEKDEKTEENRDEIVKALTDRISALEETVKEFAEVKGKLDEMAKMKAEQFGYKGYGNEGAKDPKDMSVEELEKICQIKN